MSNKRAVLQSVCNNYEDLINLTSPHNAEYASKIGFEYILHKNYFDISRAPAWLKMYSIQHLFKEGYDEILLIDGDALVIDKQKNITDLKKEGKSIHICCDGLGNAKKLHHVNTGVMYLERNDFTIQFIDNVINNPESAYWYDKRNWEQNAIHNEFRKATYLYSRIVQLYESNYFNHNSDWIFHPCWAGECLGTYSPREFCDETEAGNGNKEKFKWIEKKLKYPKQDIFKI